MIEITVLTFFGGILGLIALMYVNNLLINNEYLPLLQPKIFQ